MVVYLCALVAIESVAPVVAIEHVVLVVAIEHAVLVVAIASVVLVAAIASVVLVAAIASVVLVDAIEHVVLVAAIEHVVLVAAIASVVLVDAIEHVVLVAAIVQIDSIIVELARMVAHMALQIDLILSVALFFSLIENGWIYSFYFDHFSSLCVAQYAFLWIFYVLKFLKPFCKIYILQNIHHFFGRQ
jgi:hypothetical protein